MGVRALAEAVILQSLEDLYHPAYRSESLRFFAGEGFRRCAHLAGLSLSERLRLLALVRALKEGQKTLRRHAS
jgi:hypothetical protein